MEGNSRAALAADRRHRCLRRTNCTLSQGLTALISLSTIRRSESHLGGCACARRWRVGRWLWRCISRLASGGSLALAGGGPENVLLLVNSNSPSSKTIANNYIQLRNIPASNVVYIDWDGPIEECGAIKFRDQILLPTLAAIEDRKLAAQIDYVVYSSDFPWRIELKTMFPKEEFAASFHPYCSHQRRHLSVALLRRDESGARVAGRQLVPGSGRRR